MFPNQRLELGALIGQSPVSSQHAKLVLLEPMAKEKNPSWSNKVLNEAGNHLLRLLITQASRAAAADMEGVASFLFAILTSVFPYRKKVIDKNGRIALGLEGKELKAFRIGVHRHISNLFAEIFAGLSMSAEALSKRISLDMGTLFEDVKDDKRFIIMPSHQGNWEWQIAGSALKFPYRILGVYQALNQLFFEDLMRSFRTKGGAEVVPQRQILRKLVEPTEKQSLVLLMADQAAPVDNANVLPFLGTITGFYTGPQVIASRFGCKVYYVSTLPGIAPHTYVSKIERLSDDSFMEDYVARLERDIRTSPTTYLWSHNRFKHSYVG
jgi:Kdo2-lipid IVA lauroyltransferase/acyltransferase